MTESQLRVEKLLQHFAAGSVAPLHLKEGVCALYHEQGQEAVVLEVPEHSDSILLHCQLFEADAQLYPLLLQLNFEMSAMRGCWLALDEQHTVRLCFQQPLRQLDEASFSHMLSGFIAQTVEVREFISDWLSRHT
ncbi:type III secretion system chaperone [Serratia marcescens]|uniref:type III secretion system chaperone n=1 Tax=Serratia marcescens TaxID=615 RepID=UPI000D734133|nr:type III secretion system chaperone [Serratia marcescens]AWO77489.1 Tir chaperone family protein [Serratia marcescens]HDU5650184.1 CesT family type III secretion system chaperone [Klebsiella aerogenes]